jgi:uncharacterized membrane protein YhaH (DUF805 family)
MASDILAPTPETPLYAPAPVLSLRGRLRRVRYLTWTSVAALVTSLLVWALLRASGSSGLVYLVLMLGACTGWVFGVRRVMDIGWPWWLFGITFIPLLGTLFMLAMIVYPGTKGPNRYGPPTKPSTGTEIAVAVLCVIACIVLGFAFATSPEAQQLFRML